MKTDDTLERLADLQRRINEMPMERARLIQQARARRYYWTEIGAALGLSHQAAMKAAKQADAQSGAFSGTPTGDDSLETLSALQAEMGVLPALRADLIGEARRAGHSWRVIGAAIGMTHMGAYAAARVAR